MKKRPFRKFDLRSRAGMTLTEAVVALALLSVAAVLLVTVFAGALNITRNHARYKISDAGAAGVLEERLAGETASDAAVSERAGTFVIRFGDREIETSGVYLRGKDPENGQEFYVFEPKEE